MKTFAEVLTDQLKRRALRRFMAGFLSSAFIVLVGYSGYVYSWTKNEVRKVLGTATLEAGIAGQFSSELIADVKRLCTSLKCERVTLLQTKTRRIDYSFPDESVIGATAIVTENPGFFPELSRRSVQFRWNSPVITLLLSLSFWEIFRLPLLTILLLAASAGGFFMAAQRSGKEVSGLLQKELDSLMAANEPFATPTFSTLEGRNIFRIMVEQRERLRALTEIEAEHRSSQQVAKLAEQIAHDVRSPLSALSVLIASESALDEKKKSLLSAAFERINAIADSLLDQSREIQVAEKKPTLNSLGEIIQSVVAEKRLLAGDQITIKSDVEAGLTAVCRPMDLARVIANLLNNAVESIAGAGEVGISARREGDVVAIRLRDNGRGIKSEWLPKLMSRGATFGKPEGNGLGLFHAKQVVESWGGSIAISSEWGKGTEAVLKLLTES